MRFILILLASATFASAAALNGPITADGTYTVSTLPGKRYVFSAAGTFGSGTLAIKWNDGTTATAFSNSPATAAETWTFTAPSRQVDLVLSGSTAADITVGISLVDGSSPVVSSEEILDASAAGRAVLTASDAEAQRRSMKSERSGKSYASGGALAALRLLTRSQKSCGIALVGDSTGAGSNKWPSLFMNYLAAANPSYGINDLAWNGSAWSTVSTVAPPNGERYWYAADGQTDVYAALLGSGDFDIPRNQDLAVEAKVSYDTFTDVGYYQMSLWQGYGGTSADALFIITVNASKKIVLSWYESGGAFKGVASGTAIPYNTGDVFWIRAELDTDNGAGGHTLTFKHRASDTAAWTTLGSPVVTAGTSSLRTLPVNNEKSVISINPGRASNQNIGCGLKVFKIRIYDQLDPTVGALRMSPIDHFDRGATSNTVVLGGSPVITLRNASVSGLGLVDFLDPTDPQYVPFNKIFHVTDEGVCAAMISIGHNGNAAVRYSDVGSFSLGCSQVLDAMQARFANCRRVYVTQNPQLTGADREARHGLMMARIAARAGTAGDGFLNAYQAFVDDPRGVAALMGDSLHPNADGNALWASVLEDAYETRSF